MGKFKTKIKINLKKFKKIVKIIRYLIHFFQNMIKMQLKKHNQIILECDNQFQIFKKN